MHQHTPSGPAAEYSPEKVVPSSGGHAALAPQPIIWGHDNEPAGPPPPSYNDSIQASPSNVTTYGFYHFTHFDEGSSQSSSAYPQPSSSSFSTSYQYASVTRQTSAQSSLSTTDSLDGSSTVCIASSAYAPSSSETGDTSSISGSSKLRGFSPSASVSQLFSPPPQSFYRTPPAYLPYTPFETTALFGYSSKLEKGFPHVPPFSSCDPHLFVTHDVNQEDWTHFLDDVKAVAKSSPVNRLVAGMVPAAMSLRMPLGSLSPIEFLVKKGVEAHMKSRRTGPVGEVLDHWNRHFFYPRRMLVVLAQGRYVYSGADTLPVDMLKTDGEQMLNSDGDSDSDTDDNGLILSTAKTVVGTAVGGILEGGRKLQKIQKERKRNKHAASTANHQNWRLVISSRPYLM
ncbi:predicted protein [Sparassis crispa]|uniref:Uncharacterized protein n=1 Tax=Sparassis crispa TaxID=139825 RepID=A0A401H460_9APHY|nr:predicted protein [Sparassis crispa]GBE89169.1 predicted protein [Sparassis crispa]